MKWQKEQLYTLLFCALAVAIFATGVVPVGAEILQRVVIAPEEYATVEAEITQILPPDQENPEKNLLWVTFPTEEGTLYTTPLLQGPEGAEVGDRLELVYAIHTPEDVVQMQYLWGQGCLYLGFSFLSVFTGLIMAKPYVPYTPRPRRSLRERLKHY